MNKLVALDGNFVIKCTRCGCMNSSMETTALADKSISCAFSCNGCAAEQVVVLPHFEEDLYE